MSYQVIMVQLDLSKATDGGNIFRFSTAMHDVVYDSNTFTAAGNLLSFDDIDTTSELTDMGIALTLSGVDPSYQRAIDTGGFKRAPIDIWVGVVDDNTNTITEAKYVHRGFCDTPNTNLDYSTGALSISLSTTSLFGDLSRTPDLCRTSYSSHKSRYPTDEFFKFVASTATEELWKS